MEQEKLKNKCVKVHTNLRVSLPFDVHRAVHLNIISVVKPTRYTNVSNLFYFGITLCMFRTVFASIRSSRLYIQQYLYDKCLLLYVQS